LTAIEGHIVLPAGNALIAVTGTVKLEDVTLADAASLTLAAAPFSSGRGDPPIPFRLNATAGIDASRDYILTAQASATVVGTGEKRRFGTRSAIPWKPGGPASGFLIHLHLWI
jgi:uncharacterized lipoprotein YbaY